MIIALVFAKDTYYPKNLLCHKCINIKHEIDVIKGVGKSVGEYYYHYNILLQLITRPNADKT